MILLCGIPSEEAIYMVREELNRKNIPHVMFNQREFKDTEIKYKIANKQISGKIRTKKETFQLEDFNSVYTRLMDYRYLPEVENLPDSSPVWFQCRSLHETLMQWFEITEAKVLHRPSKLGTNFSKPLQSQHIIEHGFKVPKTLITNDPKIVWKFYLQYKKVIFKSISSVRSIVQTLRPEDFNRINKIRWCPTQFQEFIEGTNVRVHVVDRKIFATGVKSDSIDYRYAHYEGGQTDLYPFNLPSEISRKCIELSHSLGLPVSGIDLKITPDGQVYCFEINPSPAFSYYEAVTGQPIAENIAEYLSKNF